MAASTPAQEEPAQPTSTNSPLFMGSRNDSVENDESAPLLDADDVAPPTRNASSKLIYIFTSTALSSSALALIFIIAANIALKAGHNYYGLPWVVSESMKMIIPSVSTSSSPRLFCSIYSQCFRPYSRFSSRVTTSQGYAMALV